MGNTYNFRLLIHVKIDKLSRFITSRWGNGMISVHYPEFECDRCYHIIVVSPRLLTAQTVIQCPNCQNVFGTWGDLLPRYAAEKDDDGVLHLARSADGSKLH
jgi:hypothetical protein